MRFLGTLVVLSISFTAWWWESCTFAFSTDFLGNVLQLSSTLVGQYRWSGYQTGNGHRYLPNLSYPKHVANAKCTCKLGTCAIEKMVLFAHVSFGWPFEQCLGNTILSWCYCTVLGEGLHTQSLHILNRTTGPIEVSPVCWDHQQVVPKLQCQALWHRLPPLTWRGHGMFLRSSACKYTCLPLTYGPSPKLSGTACAFMESRKPYIYLFI